MTTRPLILHALYRFDTGGLENGVVNLINRMPADRYRHAILAMDEVASGFAARIERDDVEFHALHKGPGHALRLYPTIWRLLRQLRPAVMHSRNLAALETQVVAALARVPVRIHGEHGRDVEDLDGHSCKLQRLRRAYSPFVHGYVTVSQDLCQYLVDRVGVTQRRVTRIYNGVDTTRFHPVPAAQRIEACPFDPSACFVIGTVGRMKGVKNQTLLAEAFVRMLTRWPELRPRARLAIVGDGPLRAQVQALLQSAGVADLAWLPGERRDIAHVMRGLHGFVLPSLGEGISNTILEAMASGLPVIATAVGGSVELVEPGTTGDLVPSGDIEAMAGALAAWVRDPAGARKLGQRAREVAEQRFSLDAMVAAYTALYDARLTKTMRRH